MAAPLSKPSGPPRHGTPAPVGAITRHLQRTLGAGILVMLPIGTTVVLLKFIFDLVDGILREPLTLLPGPEIPGLGLAVVVVLVYLTGLVAAHVVGRRIIDFTHRILELIPVVRSIYGTTRSAVELLSNTDNHRYSGVVWVDFPRPGIQSIGLVTSRMVDAGGVEKLTVYIPTTPIPSSGFLVMVSARDVTPTDMTVDDAMKVVISGGILAGRVFEQFGMVAAQDNVTPNQ